LFSNANWDSSSIFNILSSSSKISSSSVANSSVSDVILGKASSTFPLVPSLFFFVAIVSSYESMLIVLPCFFSTTSYFNVSCLWVAFKSFPFSPDSSFTSSTSMKFSCSFLFDVAESPWSFMCWIGLVISSSSTNSFNISSCFSLAVNNKVTLDAFSLYTDSGSCICSWLLFSVLDLIRRFLK
jgi:hypothetical protein